MSDENHENTRALVPSGTFAPQRVGQGEVWDEAAPRVLLAGPDTVYFSFPQAISDDTWETLIGEQQKARDIEQERGAEYAPDWLGGVMATSGARGGYKFRIETDAFTVKLLKGVANRPPLYVEMRSHALHLHPGGAQGACEDACTYLRDVLLADQDKGRVTDAITLDEACCSRMDLHADWQGGWHPSLAEAEDRLFVRPGRCAWHPYLAGNTCTGYRFGTGRLQARIYHKSAEVRKKHLDWYADLLALQNGANYNPDLEVWRLEYQLRREGVTGFKLYGVPDVDDSDDLLQAELAREDLPHIGTVRKALHWSGALWAYLTRHWLRLVEPNGDANRARWPTHPTWAVLQGGYAQALGKAPPNPGDLDLIRQGRHGGYERFLHRIAVGVAAMVEAQESDTKEVAHAWLAHLRHALQVEVPAIAAPGTQDRYYHLLGELLGLFTSAGVARSELPNVAHTWDLLEVLSDDIEQIAKHKGGMGQLLNDKRVKLYKLSPKTFFRQGGRT
jgi:hypothetical protein